MRRNLGKKPFVFDLDGTLVDSKAALDAEMAALLKTLLGQVKPGEEFKLSDRPTKVDSLFKSKKQYHKLLREHVEELSESHIILETVPIAASHHSATD